MISTVSEMIQHQRNVNHPLGAAGYVFKDGVIDYLTGNLDSPNVKISIGAQPNAPPHFGTLLVSCLAFSVAEQIEKNTDDLNTEVVFEAVDTAPASTQTIQDVEYQTSLRYEGRADEYMPDFLTIFDYLRDTTGVAYSVRRQREFNQQAGMQKVLSAIVETSDDIVDLIDPEYRNLRMRVACPECGLTDKKGVNTTINKFTIHSHCPHHGSYETHILEETQRLEYNTPLRNLVRALVYSRPETDHSVAPEWLRVTGKDYAGYYQEQLLYSCASQIGYLPHTLPTIVYAPLVIDWSGAKLSKTLYVEEGAYDYLPSYLINFREFKDTHGEEGIGMLYNETSRWLKEPYRLFRNYTVYYFMEVFNDG